MVRFHSQHDWAVFANGKTMIFIAGMTIAVFFEFLLLGKKNKSEADKILAVWMFLVTLHLFLFYMFFTGELFHYPFLLGLNMPIPLLHAVLLYLYVGSVTNQLPAQRKILILHFLPAGAAYLYLIPFFLLPAEQKILITKNEGAGYETFNTVLMFAIRLSGIAYVAWSALLLRRHRRRILDRFSYQDKIDLQWLRILTWGMGCIWLLIFITNDVILFGAVAVFTFLIGFFGIKQERIFGAETPPLPEPDMPGLPEPEKISLPEETEKAEEKAKYAKSGLTKERADTLYRDLTRLMEKEAMYKRSDLSVDDLAARLAVHPNYLSQIINEKEGKNFYDFVNFYRLEEFKRLLADPRNRNLTLLSLAFDCGFNSKSSFNRHFKKVTGQTPSEYFASLTRQ